MIKNLFRCCVAVLAFATLNGLFPAYAQNSHEEGVVSGVISDDKGPVIGAAVMVKGGTTGVTTGMDGEYTLSGLKSGDVIVVSILGYNDLELTYEGQEILNGTLTVSTEFLDEVVVTALGIKRSEKALSYNVQQVKSEELLRSKDVNFINSLNGKIAGVTINKVHPEPVEQPVS